MRKKAKKSFSIWLIAVVVLSLLILWPPFRSGYWESDDGEWMVIRFSAFHESLRDGHFPVRWTQRLNHHYGYPVFNFLYPLPFYLAEIPHLVGFGFVDSVKLVFGGSVVLAAIGMYLFAKKWGEIPAFIASLVYIYAPYRAFLLYTRGSLGESVALAVVPFVFFFADRIVRKPNWRSVIGMGAAYAALIMSHNVIALLFIPVLLFYLGNLIHKSKNRLYALRSALSAVLLGLALSAFFWIPALWDLQFTKAGGIRIADYQSYFLDLKRLVSMLGIVPLAFVALATMKKKWFFPAVALVAALFIHPISSSVTKLLPIIEKIQFPWRIATVFMFASAASAGLVTREIRKIFKNSQVVALLISLALFAAVLPATKNIKFVDREEGFYSTNDDTTTVQNEFTPIWVSQDPTDKPETPFEITATQETYQILQQELRTGKYYLQIRLQEPAKITFNTHYFPGWRVYVDGKEIAFNPEETDGLLQVTVTPGQDKLRDIKAVFEKTPVRQLAESLSLIALIAIFAIAIFKKLPKTQVAKGVGVLSLTIALVSLGFFVFVNLHTYRQVFDPQKAEAAYLNSQWVNPYSGTNVPIGDSGLYSWAGWEYIHGKNPILINSEMPPLGKYVIGVGLLLTKRAAVVGFALSSFALVTLFFLAKELLKDRWLAAAATSLFALEPVLRSLFNITMLDGLYIGFLNLTFLFYIKGLREKRLFFLSSLMLGAMASTKFYAGAVSVAIALLGFLVLSRKWEELKYFVLSLPLVGVVHAASYAAFFAHGNSFRSYLGVQKWIFNFYRQGNVGTVPPGSYWLLVLFNRWRIWFGQEWGVFTTIKSDLWRVSWPINVLAALALAYVYVRKKVPEGYGVLLTWLGVYSIFLTFTIGWPHYMLLFLPYSSILLVELIRQIAPKLSKHLRGV